MLFAPVFWLFLPHAVRPTSATTARPYTLNSFYAGDDFIDPAQWTWETLPDPTHGRVDYVDLQTANASNLFYAEGDRFLMGADSINNVPPASRGRQSVRISSMGSWDVGLIILDLDHMPSCCSCWPAFWTLSANGPWPGGGEIDVIEGVHKASHNLASLHTVPDCQMDQIRDQTGFTVSTDCDARKKSNQGCGTVFNDTENSFGKPFNDAGGGFYAMEKAEDGIKIWFWSRDSPAIPPEILFSSRETAPRVIDPYWWGIPRAHFPTTQCDYQQHFDAHKMVFDLTFCGDWAGGVWDQQPDCPTTQACPSFVDNNPKEFEEAYWEITSLRVYTPVGI